MNKLLDNDAAEKPRVQTAARTIKVLTEVALAGPNGISAKAISANLDLPRQVVYHLLHTLVSVGVLRRANGSTYVLGLAVAPIAEGFRLQLGAGDMLARYATMAANATGETAYVVGWVGNEIVVLASARGGSAIAATEIPQGTTGDAHARASGKLLLSHIPPEALDDYIARHPLVARTPNTITTRKELVSTLDRIREESVGYDREEYSTGLACMAVPLGSRRMVRLALGISAPAERFNANLDNYREMLLNIASIQDVDGS
ncbi:IclR family transcriptional regulator [Rhizobium leguminosarum]